jgi:hypothetical protein
MEAPCPKVALLDPPASSCSYQKEDQEAWVRRPLLELARNRKMGPVVFAMAFAIPWFACLAELTASLVQQQDLV